MMKENKYPDIDMAEASQILANAFAANDMEENEIPLEVLASYSNYRKERFLLQRIIVLLLLVLFFLLPILFVRPKLALRQVEDASKGRPAYEATVDIWLPLPISKVTASIDGVNMPVYEVDTHVYSVLPTANGEMEVVVTLINDQRAQTTVQVTGYDTASPVLLDNGVEDELLVFYLSDDWSGVDYDAVVAMTLDGKEIRPVSMDPETGRVAFKYPTESLNVIFPDKAGNRLQIVVSLRKTVTETIVPEEGVPEEDAPENAEDPGDAEVQLEQSEGDQAG